MKLLNYVSKPYICQTEKPNISKLIFYCLTYFVIAFTSIIIIFPITSLFGLEHISQKGYSITAIITGIIFAPIYEEIICRLCLIANKKNYYIVLISLISLIIISLFREKYWTSIILLVVFLLLLSLKLIKKTKLRATYNVNFKYIFWLSSILFGLLHVTNFRGNYLVLLALSPILCFPQIAMGFILGYIRMNYGFKYGVIVHMIINSTLLVYLF
ncbi:MAG: CPBP family glutamic-type intramembrane protease [Paludibacter sp.]